MAKFELPDSVFDTEITAGSVDKAVKGAGGKVSSEAYGKLYHVPVSAIKVIPGFNVRIETPKHVAHRRTIANSIKENGFLSTKPLSGYAGREGDDHVIYVTDGHTRLESAQLAISEGAPIETLPVVLQPPTSTKEDLTFQLLTANSGKSLTGMEKAVVVKRLVGFNVEKAEIARRLDVTDRMVDNYVLLAGAPKNITDLVAAELVSATEAVKALSKNPKTAYTVLKAAVEAAKAAGKEKATGKHVKAASAESSGDATGDTTTKTKTTTTAKKGETTEKQVFRFKAGDTHGYDTMKHVRLINDGDWWNFTNEAKDTVQIESPITIELIVTTPTPQEADAGTAEDQTDNTTTTDDDSL